MPRNTENRDPNPIAITVDVEYPDRPSSVPLRALDRIIEIAESNPITFFVQGRWALAHPDRVRRISRVDPGLSLHGYSHVDYTRLTAQGQSSELHASIKALTSIVPNQRFTFFRFPHGQGARCPSALTQVARHELQAVGWDFSSRDWDARLAFDEVLECLLPACEVGGIVLFHSWVERTPEAIVELIAHCKKSELVGMNDMPLRHHGGNGLVYHEETHQNDIRSNR